MKKLVIIFTLLAMTASLSSVYAQSDDIRSLPAKELWKRAEAYVMVNMFEEALDYYLVLFEQDSTNKHVAFKLGYCYLQSEKAQDINNAIDFLLIASTDINKKFSNRINDKSAPIETNFFLGVAYRLKRDYKTALDYYKDFQKDFSSAKMNIVSQNQLDLEIRSCTEADKERNYSEMMPYNFKMKNTQQELKVRCPIYAYEADMLFFTLGEGNTFPPDLNFDREYDYKPLDSIFYSRRINDSLWDEPVNISPMLQIGAPAMPVTATPDGKFLYLVIDVGDNGDIYVSERNQDGSYGIPKALNRNINTRHWESFASITSDGKRLYFTSMRPGGIGGLDIYYSDADDKGNWGEAVNLGAGINTPGFEEMPYIARNDRELYFSSEGHSTTGGFDVFYVAYLQRDNSWSSPINVGFPFNTDGNDMGYIVEFDGDFAFCPVNSSKRRTGYEDCDCISLKREKTYRPIVINCIVNPDETLKSLPDDMMLYVVNNTSGDTVKAFTLFETQGNVNFTLPSGDYTFYTHSEWADPSTTMLNVPLESDDINLIIPVSAQLTAQNPDKKNNPFLMRGATVTCTVIRDNTLAAMPADLMLYVFNDDTREMVKSFPISDNKNITRMTLPEGNYTFKTESKFANPSLEKLQVKDPDQSYEVTIQISAPSDQIYTVTWVQFDFDMYNIKPEFHNNLDSLADYLKKYTHAIVAIHGHTDPFGSNEYNIALGLRRANAVKDYLVKKGVNTNQLTTETYGEERRVAKGESVEARKYDRRVEFMVQKQGGITLKVIPRMPPAKYAAE